MALAMRTAYRFIEKLRDCYMNQLATDPTRGRGSNKPSLLDLVLTNNKNLVTSMTHTAALGRSDHAMPEIKLTCDTTTQKQNQKIFFEFKKGDYDKNEKN